MYKICENYLDVLRMFRIFAANFKDMAKFFLRTQKQEGVATLYITIQKRTPKVSLRFVSTGISVDVQTWNKANKSIRAWNRFIATDEGVELNRKMQIVAQTIDQLFADGRIGGNEDKAVIEDALREISNAQAIQVEQEVKRIKEEQEERNRRNIVGFYHHFMQGIEDGSIRYGAGNRYTKGSIEVWRGFEHVLTEFCPANMTFDDINKSFADRFVTFLEDKGYMVETANKMVARFHKLCNQAAEEGVNSNAVSLRLWKRKPVRESDKRTEIYLTDMELDALYAMKLTGRQEHVRDMFFIGYLSGQRISDYGTLSADNFKRVEGGMDVISLKQKKTGNYVEVPIWDDRVFEIAEKYNYRFPVMRRWDINEVIKVVLYELSATVPSLCEKIPTLLTVHEKKSEQTYIEICEKRRQGIRLTVLERNNYYHLKHEAQMRGCTDGLFERNTLGQAVKPKWELVSSHTARRSSITNLYKSGILNNREMMSISGHRDERIFEEYIKVGTSEQAQLVGEKLKKAKEVVLKNAQ